MYEPKHREAGWSRQQIEELDMQVDLRRRLMGRTDQPRHRAWGPAVEGLR